MKTLRSLFSVALLLILVGSCCASLQHSSMLKVNISEIEFETERGTLSGYLYMPKEMDIDSKRPVIVLTHGYLNTKEMQDAPAIEMSKRGYIVLALDMYDHGDSRWEADIETGKEFSTFWLYSQLDAANYMASQDYTLKDEFGNAYIAVSGHSMGGFSTILAMYMDEMASLTRGTRNIFAGLPVAADFSYASFVASQEDIQAAFGDRTVGIIAAKYDEFFFNPDVPIAEGSVTRKDFTETTSGKLFLGTEEATAGKFYSVQSGDVIVDNNVVRKSQSGQRIIYTPNEIHPWNHFSASTTALMIEFYQTVFAGVIPEDMVNANLDPNSQSWILKELSNFIAMIGFFLLIVSFAGELLKLPFFKNAITDEAKPVSPPSTNSQKILDKLILVISLIYPVILFPVLMDRQEIGINILTIGSGIMLIISIWLLIKFYKNQSFYQAKAMMYTAIISIAGILLFQLSDKILITGPTFNQPTTNQIVFWALGSTVISAIILAMVYSMFKVKLGDTAQSYGLTWNISAIISSFATSLVSVVGAYIILFIIQAIFKVDFRIWTWAVRTFKIEHLITALRYMPFLFIFYFINVIVINANTRKVRGEIIIALLLNVGGLCIWVALQYGFLFLTGVAFYPAQALNGILLFATIPCLIVAAIYAKVLFEKTNNAWLAGFLNTMLFTMIISANTVTFWNLV
ncbi:hypothetical protein AN639_00390 [Candidatus Epulonipiscium fishelsonii]|uniref:Uncharacterized protein n=1 Tax=Candidatus Epulonipiscium fishelsonii TaxID=77094 RepID=A0ACC8XCS3_9FIRM|nr:hypothetical protein AN396_05390 [Epulopiscium sp. SCG-B11WGA-EpuloA1]ONI41844.1 hypothetical protein AN639_00390 [Epulopiscium sp. SCG-B05WGA-EpuloA1]